MTPHGTRANTLGAEGALTETHAACADQFRQKSLNRVGDNSV